MATWPGSLPQLPASEGYTESLPNTTLRTQMDQGPAKTRRQYTSNVRPLTMRLILTTAQVATFDDFFITDVEGGALSFTWVNPRTEVSQSLRFVGVPNYTHLGAGKYEVKFNIEQMI